MGLIDSVSNKTTTTPKPKRLGDEPKRFIVEALGCFQTATQVARAANEQFGLQLTKQAVQAYDPTTKAGAGLSAELREMFESARREYLSQVSVTFDTAPRECVESTIREVAAFRGWKMHALAVQTNHVHVVISADCAPEKAMNDFKSCSTRHLRKRVLVPANAPIWSKHGSTKYLNTHTSLTAACQYVVENQADLSDCP